MLLQNATFRQRHLMQHLTSLLHTAPPPRPTPFLPRPPAQNNSQDDGTHQLPLNQDLQVRASPSRPLCAASLLLVGTLLPYHRLHPLLRRVLDLPTATAAYFVVAYSAGGVRAARCGVLQFSDGEKLAEELLRSQCSGAGVNGRQSCSGVGRGVYVCVLLLIS